MSGLHNLRNVILQENLIFILKVQFVRYVLICNISSRLKNYKNWHQTSDSIHFPLSFPSFFCHCLNESLFSVNNNKRHKKRSSPQAQKRLPLCATVEGQASLDSIIFCLNYPSPWVLFYESLFKDFISCTLYTCMYVTLIIASLQHRKIF